MPTQKTITVKATDRHAGLSLSQLAGFVADLEHAGSAGEPTIKAYVTVAGRLREISATITDADEA